MFFFFSLSLCLYQVGGQASLSFFHQGHDRGLPLSLSLSFSRARGKGISPLSLSLSLAGGSLSEGLKSRISRLCTQGANTKRKKPHFSLASLPNSRLPCVAARSAWLVCERLQGWVGAGAGKVTHIVLDLERLRRTCELRSTAHSCNQPCGILLPALGSLPSDKPAAALKLAACCSGGKYQ